jgi:hypothetical protein
MPCSRKVNKPERCRKLKVHKTANEKYIFILYLYLRAKQGVLIVYWFYMDTQLMFCVRAVSKPFDMVCWLRFRELKCYQHAGSLRPVKQLLTPLLKQIFQSKERMPL